MNGSGSERERTKRWMGLTDEGLLLGMASDGRTVDMVKWMNQKHQVLCMDSLPFPLPLIPQCSSRGHVASSALGVLTRQVEFDVGLCLSVCSVCLASAAAAPRPMPPTPRLILILRLFRRSSIALFDLHYSTYLFTLLDAGSLISSISMTEIHVVEYCAVRKAPPFIGCSEKSSILALDDESHRSRRHLNKQLAQLHVTACSRRLSPYV